MTRRRLSQRVIMAAALTLPVALVEAGPGGAIPVQASIPDMVQKGWEYRVALVPSASAPAGSQLTDVSWRYELAMDGPVPAAWLCAPSDCVALPMARGSTDALAGLPADTPLSLHLVLPGEGMLKRPVRGGTAQVFVNYQMQDR